MTVPARRPDALATARLEQLIAVREQLAPKASDRELALFAQVCTQLDLNPFADQIVLVGRWDSRVGREVHRHQVTVAGRRAIAERTGDLIGIVGPEWCGPRTPAGELVWSDVWDDDDTPPYCARVFVHRRGWVQPANGTAKWSEFVQTAKDGRPGPLWSRMPSHMLGKVAESLALRRAFPDVITPALEAVPAWIGPAASEAAESLEADPATVPDPWDTPDPEAALEAIERTVDDPGDDWGDDPMAAPFDPPGPGNPVALDAYPLTGDLIGVRDWWTERARAAGVPLARLVIKAREFAFEMGTTEPRTAGEITTPALVNALLAWLDAP